MRRLLSILVLLLGTTPTFAQDIAIPPLSAVHNGDVWLYGFADEPLRITDGTAARYTNLVWSPDGNYLAFVALDESFRASLWLYNRTGNSLMLVEGEVPAGFPISFTEDSRELLFLNDSTPPGSEPGNPMGVYTYDVAGGTSRTQLATIDLGEGCGGGSSFAGDWRYWDETEGLGGFGQVLELTAYGLVYSRDCGYSTTLLNVESGEEFSLGSITRASLSTDRTTLAGITYQRGDRTNERLVVVNLETRETTPLETSDIPDQVAWGASGELFYSTRQMSDRMIISSEEELERINAILGPSGQAHVWEVSIHRFDLATHEDTQVYAADAYAVGRMSVADNGSLIFSQVANAEAWLREIGEGRLDTSDPIRFQESVELVPVQLFILPIDGGQPELLGDDLRKAALHPAP